MMAARNLTIDDLKLDLQNPRIGAVSDQHAAMQAMVDEQGVKLANLAESIVDEAGLNPMDVLLVMKDEDGRYIVLEGNRRTLALKLLLNPSALTGLNLIPAVQKRVEAAAARFDRNTVEPVRCFEVATRSDAATWIDQRHRGEDEGRGIVRWSSEAGSRFSKGDPALQALDFVRQHGKLTEDEQKALSKFPLTTLDRLLSTPAVRKHIGFEIKDNKLQTALPADEAIKPLKRIALDLAIGRNGKKTTVTELKLVGQQVEYIKKLEPADMPDLTKAGADLRSIEDIPASEFKSKAPRTPRTKKPPTRLHIVPKGCPLNVTGNRIAEIYIELTTLRLATHRNAIAVLGRVFMELSVDHYLTANSIKLKYNKGGKDHYKSLTDKVKEAVAHMTAAGADADDFKGINRALSSPNDPLSIDLQNAYVHNRNLTPSENDLVIAWNNAQPFFEHIWK
jgi:hypothetical protein